MGDGSSLVNLGDISKPATVLIEKISDAVGGIFKPYQITRIAKAEAEAEKIKAMAGIEVSEIQQRGIVRLIQEEGKKQENIETITSESIKQLKEDSKPENIEDDWLMHFFDKCKLASDKEMQTLWSKILAGEANEPGAYSKKTVELLSILDKKDAQLFSNLCIYSIASGSVFPIIHDVQNEIYTKRGINFQSLSHLEDIGLVKFDNLTGFALQRLPKQITLLYFGIPMFIESKEEANNKLNIGKVMLTKAGQELAPIAGSVMDIEFMKYLIGEWKTQGHIVTSPIA